MKDNIDKIRNQLELREKQFDIDIRKYFRIFGIPFLKDNSRIIQDVISNVVRLRELNLKEFSLMLKECDTPLIRWYRFVGKIRKPFSKVRHRISELFRRECLCHDCIQKSLSERQCGMMKYMEKQLLEESK